MAFTHLHSEGPERAHLVETNAQLQRTLVIGLGGTGCEVIKRLKRRLARQAQASPLIRFLSLDTDVRSWLSYRLPAMEPRERVLLSHANPANVLEAPHLYPTIQHLFFQGKKVDISILADANGAGLMPVVGRTAFHLNASAIYAQMDKALRDLQAIRPQPGGQPLTDDYRIYVIGSAAGGTGAGCFLETAVLVRHVFRTYKYRVIGLLALPEAFAPTLRGQQLDAQAKGNAYAVLKELQYLQDGQVYWDDPETYSFQYNLGGNVQTVTLQGRPFDILYMIDNQNQDGGALRNLTDIYEMASQQLSVEIGSPFGAKFTSAQANDRAVMGLAPCPETQRPANISSLATAALVIPEEKLVRFCSRKYLQEVLRDRLLGAGGSSRETEQNAAAWLMAAGLEERGGHRMVSRLLLTDPREEREVTAGEFAPDPEAMAEKSVAEYLSAFAAQEDYFAAQGLPQVKSMADRNLERLRSELPARISLMLEEASSAGGVRGALSARAAVDRELQAMAADLARQQNDAEAHRGELADRLQSQREALERKSGLLGGLFGKRKELMHQLGLTQGDVMQVQLDMLARSHALRLAEAARTMLDEHRRKLEALDSHLTRALHTVEAELTQESWEGELGTAYALETDVILPEHYPGYYDRFRPASAEGFLAAISDGAGLLRALVGQEYTEVAGRLHRAAWAIFQEHVDRLSVVDVLQNLYSRERAFELLDDLARRCQPFWTAMPRGANGFSDVFLIGSPGVRRGGSAEPMQAEPLLQEWVEKHAGGAAAGLQSQPTYVALGSPNAVIFSRQTHGARLHYMRQILDYQEHYRTLLQQRGYPLHFKPGLEALPELRPDDDKATECWALAVAYGMVAARTFGWVWALETEQRKDPDMPGGFGTVDLLRTGSLWDLAAEIAPVETREIAPHSSKFLHANRSGAMGQFAQRRECVASVDRMLQRRLDAAGKQSLAAELTRYMEEILCPRMKRTDEMDAATLTREYAAVRRFLGRLNL